MRRRRRTPGTQFARAGERTTVLLGDEPVDQIRFRATSLTGAPTGQIEMDVGESLPRRAPLAPEQTLPAQGLRSLAIVPDHDTAITFLPVDRPSSPAFLWLGGALLLGAVGWTAWDFVVG